MSRQEHILSIKQFNPKEIDSTQYHISCHLPSVVLVIIIILPQGFPESKPLIKTQPEIQHPWFQNGVLENDQIINWNPSRSVLGFVVEELMTFLTLNPPKTQQFDSQLLKKYGLESKTYSYV
jgi:hypothetical protein